MYVKITKHFSLKNVIKSFGYFKTFFWFPLLVLELKFVMELEFLTCLVLRHLPYIKQPTQQTKNFAEKTSQITWFLA